MPLEPTNFDQKKHEQSSCGKVWTIFKRRNTNSFSIFLNDEHPRKEHILIEVTDEGIEIWNREEQESNTYGSISFIKKNWAS